MAADLSIRLRRALESAQGYLLLEMPDAALRELRIFQSQPEVIVAAEQLSGEAYRQKEEYEAALQHFERVLAAGESNLELRMSMAWCYKRVGRLDRAIEAMRAAYRDSPKEAVVLYNLACYLSLAGERDEALSWLGRAFRLDPKYRELVASEPDFDPIRNHPDFLQLMQLSEPKPKPSRS
jgi:tetratricopeptide (TPR) repeat protein